MPGHDDLLARHEMQEAPADEVLERAILALDAESAELVTLLARLHFRLGGGAVEGGWEPGHGCVTLGGQVSVVHHLGGDAGELDGLLDGAGSGGAAPGEGHGDQGAGDATHGAAPRVTARCGRLQLLTISKPSGSGRCRQAPRRDLRRKQHGWTRCSARSRTAHAGPSWNASHAA